MPFQSEFKGNKQLLACAESDPAHIGRSFNAKGEHVKLIIKALNAWLSRENLNPMPTKLDESLDIYTDQVAKRVALFKTKKGILNFRNQIDDIVGIKTVAALDKELPVEVTPVEIEASFLDVIVHFQGDAAARELSEDEVMPDSQLSLYRLKKIVPKTRKLVRVGFKTAGFGPDAQFARTLAMIKINKELSEDFSLGQVFIYGSSSGGRNALTFAEEFASRHGRLASYLAVADPAFFPQETQTVPDQVPLPTNVPEFLVSAKANIKKNFFQTAGNQSTTRTFSDVKIFVSEMREKEIHGEIKGFKPFDKTELVTKLVGGLTGKTRADELHKELCRFALTAIQGDISVNLNSLP